VRLCRDAAARFGCAVSGEHLFADEELSGANGRRPGYQRLFAGARDHAFDAIIVEAQDRLWRNQAEMHQAITILRFLGVKVFSVATGSDLTDYSGRVLATVLGLKDEMFLEDLRAKTYRGMIGNVLRGGAPGGRAFGYRSEPVRDEAGGVIGYRRVIDPTEAEIVRYIFRLYAVENLTPRAIAHRLNAEGVASPRTAQGHRSGSWTPSTITGSAAKGTGILRNPLYHGHVVWNRSQKVRDPETGKRVVRLRPQSKWLFVEAPDLRIVPEDLWRRVETRRERRAWTADPATHGGKPRHLLSGLMTCAECGGRYIIKHHRRGVRHYGCAVHADRGPVVCRNGGIVRQDVIEQKILAHVFGDLFAPHRLAYLVRAVDAAMARALERSADTIGQRERALADAKRELNNIATAIRAGIITPTTRAMLEDAERRVAALEQGIREAKDRRAPVVSVQAAVERYLRDLRATLGTNVDEARRLLALAVDRIVLRREGKRLVAQVTGNLTGMFALEPSLCASDGAGSPATTLATMPPKDLIVA